MDKNKTDFSTMSNGTVNARYNTDRKTVEVEPMKATGDIKDQLPDPKGVAKASPKFQRVEAEDTQSEEEKKKALAQNTQKVDEEGDGSN